MDLRDADVASVIDDAKGRQQPHDHADDHDDVENLFDLRIHRDVGVDQPEQHADDDQRDDNRNQ